MKHSFITGIRRGISSVVRFLGRFLLRSWIGLVRPLRFVAAETSRFLIYWWKTRKPMRLLGGLPALLVFVIAGAGHLAATVSSHNQSQLFETYQNAARVAMERKNYPEAKLYLERLTQFPSVDNETLFEFAKVAQLTEDYPRMAATLRTLSPDDRAVYAPAHLWQATQILQQPTQTLQDLNEAQIHLQHTLELRPEDVNAHIFLGDVLFVQQRWDEALPHLQDAADKDPARKLKLAKNYGFLGDVVRGRRYAEESRLFFEGLAAQRPLDVPIRISWAESCLLLERFEEADRILQDALAIKDDESARFALSQVMLTWSDSIEESAQPDRQMQLELLSRGVAAFPDHLMLFDRILALLAASEATSAGVKEFLQKNIVEGRAMGLSHMVLGADAFRAGQVEQAATHMERAFELLPNADVTANNLAWLLTHATPPQPERALALIEPVVKRNPESSRFLDTRGHAYLAAGRYREAVSDLERALKAMNQNSKTHTALAKCYAELGLPELAEKHLTAAKSPLPSVSPATSESLPPKPRGE